MKNTAQSINSSAGVVSLHNNVHNQALQHVNTESLHTRSHLHAVKFALVFVLGGGGGGGGVRSLRIRSRALIHKPLIDVFNRELEEEPTQ